ncbi:unnamed protein product [Rotaria socialis]
MISKRIPSDTLLQVCNKHSQINSIYILCSKDINTAKTFETSIKIREFYADLGSLCNQLKQLPSITRFPREGFTRNDFTINSLSSMAYSCIFSTTSISQLQSSQSYNPVKHQEAEFIYALLLRDILIETESTPKEMIEFCLEKYCHNDLQLKYIEEFDEYYIPCNAIFWYTRDTFLYRLLNAALREQDIDTLYLLRFFIKDLHLQLKECHAIQQQMSNTIIDAPVQRIETVYRGQLMINEEFDKKIRYNTGSFFSVNSFLSTTAHKDLASVYAGNVSNGGTCNMQSVLFEIDIDKTINKFPYANISTESAFNEVESEILFTVGAVFRIQSVDWSDQGLWNVKLKLTGEEDIQLQNLTKYMKENIIWLHPLVSLGDLLRVMAQYKKAEQFYLLALQEPYVNDNVRTVTGVYNDLATIYNEMRESDKAIEYYEKSLDIKVKHFSENDPSLAPTYANLGSMACDAFEYDLALTYYKKALDIDQSTLNPNQNGIAVDYNSIGLVYKKQKRYREAMEMYEKSIEIRLKIFPSNHPSLSTSYNNIAMIYSAQRNYTKTIEYLQKTLEIQLNSLPPHHPPLAITYQNLSMAYDRQHQSNKALECMKKAYQIDLKNLPADDPKLVQNLEWITDVEKRLLDMES